MLALVLLLQPTGALDVALTPVEVASLTEAVEAVPVTGDRYSPAAAAMIDR